MNIFKRLKLYYTYYKTIKDNSDNLKNLGYSIDWFGRIGKIVSIKRDKIPSEYLTRTQDIENFSKTEVQNEFKKINLFFNNIGLFELTKVYKTKKYDKYSYEVQIGFSLINTNILGKGLIYSGLFLLFGLILLFIINFLISINIISIIMKLTITNWIFIIMCLSFIFVIYKEFFNKK